MHTRVRVCGSHHDDGGADASSLTEPQAVVLLLGEDGRLVVGILHIHDHLQGAQQTQRPGQRVRTREEGNGAEGGWGKSSTLPSIGDMCAAKAEVYLD